MLQNSDGITPMPNGALNTGEIQEHLLSYSLSRFETIFPGETLKHLLTGAGKGRGRD